MRSCLYRATVRHRREGPRPHEFRYGVRFVYLDLGELDEVFRGRWLWSVERPNLVSFRRADYLGDPETPLREAVLDRVEAELGRRPTGSVAVLTQLRTAGYLFNPVSFYYCRDESGALDAIVAEITNTPWKERHAYVLDAQACEGDRARFRFSKAFHVSPFFDMDQVYEWEFTDAGEEVAVSMTNVEDGRPVFRAGLTGERRPVTFASLAGALLASPLQPLRVHAAIYWQAARLWLKRTPFFVHPDKRAAVQETPTS